MPRARGPRPQGAAARSADTKRVYLGGKTHDHRLGLANIAVTIGREFMAGPAIRVRAGESLRVCSYSHSMVPGGFDVMSSVTRLTSRTSLVMRVEMRASTSYGTRVQSAVIASSDETGRRTTGWP